jgi:hypothetical protein
MLPNDLAMPRRINNATTSPDVPTGVGISDLLGGTNCLECGWPADACDCEPEPWKCPACGGRDTWFDRTIELHPDGTESGMKTRCTKCGRDVDELMPPNVES